MQIAMVGLGRMGSSMVRRLLRGGHACVAYDVDKTRAATLSADGAAPAKSLEDLVQKLNPPRIVWSMLPAGEVTGGVIRDLAQLLDRGDIVIDGGNSHYEDDIVHSKSLAERGIEFVDCGTSGGVWGATRGYCLMIGGRKEIVDRLTPIFRTLAPGEGSVPRTPGREGPAISAEQGFLYCGPAGSGHFVKMVHNGIEYGLMESFAEGFELLHRAETFGYRLPLPEIAEVWRRGSVISAWLLDLVAAALAESPELAMMTGRVADSGEGRWTVQAAVHAGVPCPAITEALYTRFRSQVEHTFGEKVLSAMRHGFGGHQEAPEPVHERPERAA